MLRAALEQLQSGLYRYNTRQQRDAAFDRLVARLYKGRDTESAFLRLSAVTAQVRCGHTYPSFIGRMMARGSGERTLDRWNQRLTSEGIDRLFIKIPGCTFFA